MWKVLIADDEALVIRSIIRHIHWEAWQLELCGIAQDGEELLKKIQSLNPDIVITDICMPGMSGLEVIAKALSHRCAPRFIITSAYTTFEYARSALQLGVDEFLPKPISDSSIQQALQTSLKKLGAGTRAQPRQNCFIATACQYIEENFEKPLQLRDVAQHVYLSPSYFSMLFKEKVGMNFVEYLTQVRLEHAKKWLEDIQYSMDDVAAMVGYSNKKYFSKVFKEATGLTPGEWRCGEVSSTP